MIYHIAIEAEWNQQLASPEFAPAAFEREGFVHASRAHQVAGVANRYYKDRTDLLLLEIDELKLKGKRIDEPGTGGQLFPHVYGKINKDAIVRVGKFDVTRWTS